MLRYYFGQLIRSLTVLGFMMPAFAQDLPSDEGHIGKSGVLKLEGKSFHGRIRAKGIIGLFGVKGTLTFKDGLMVWSAKGSEDSAYYEIEEMDGIQKFTSHVLAKGGTYVDWGGT